MYPPWYGSSTNEPLSTATDPSTIRVRLAYGDDPWVRSVDPNLYQRWVQELRTEPVSFLICSGQFSHLPENLLMWLAWRMQARHQESRVEAWDFPTSHSLRWIHRLESRHRRDSKAEKRRYGPDNPNPAWLSPEEVDARYEAMWPKKQRFWRRIITRPRRYRSITIHNVVTARVEPPKLIESGKRR